jgi:hypothetical protein
VVVEFAPLHGVAVEVPEQQSFDLLPASEYVQMELGGFASADESEPT